MFLKRIPYLVDNHMFQYFLQIVPTKVDTSFSTVETYQYAATESVSTIGNDS